MKIQSSFICEFSRFFKQSTKTLNLHFQPRHTSYQDLRVLNELKNVKNLAQIPVLEEEKEQIAEALIQDANSPGYSAY